MMDSLRTFLETEASQLEWKTVLVPFLRVLLILIASWVIMRFVRSALKRLQTHLLRQAAKEGDSPLESQKRTETIINLLRQAARLSITLTALLMILKQVGVEIAPVIASAGIVGLALGFGAQNLVKDVISGFFIILENQIRVGDVAMLNGTGGLVEKIRFRTTVLRDLGGIVHVFPNGSITTLSNLTLGWSAYVFDIGVAYKEDTDRVTALLREVGRAMKQDPTAGANMLEEPEIFGVDKFDDSAVIIKGRIRTLPIKQWEVGREFLRRVKHAFNEEGIEIPFPHTSLYFGEASKPLLVETIHSKTDDTAPSDGESS